MSFLILVRHGQSIWNLEKRFTGWVDIDLTEKGISEAKKAGLLIKKENIEIDFYYSSLQLRANNTLSIIQKVLNDKKNFSKAWQLNERHYGALTGLNKIEMTKKIGEDKVHEFRRSWDVKPDALDKKSQYHPVNIKTYSDIPKELIPDTESLKDTYERVIKYFEEQIKLLTIYLFFLSVILEIFHLIIPDRSFQWTDLFGNFLGVIIVILINNLINKYGFPKK